MMEQIVCPGCGTLNPVNQRYCGCCGAPVQAADALLHYASPEAPAREPAPQQAAQLTPAAAAAALAPSGAEEDPDATRVWRPRSGSGQAPSAPEEALRPAPMGGPALPPEPDPRAPVWTGASGRPMELRSERDLSEASAGKKEGGRHEKPAAELPELEFDDGPARPGFFRTRAGRIVLVVLILAAAVGLIAGAIAIGSGIAHRTNKNTDVGQPTATGSPQETSRPLTPAEMAEQTLRTFLTDRLIGEEGVAPAVTAAPLNGGTEVDAEGIRGLLLAELYDYLDEGMPQLLVVLTAEVRMDPPLWDPDAAAGTAQGVELRLYRYEAGTVRLYASCPVDGFGFAVRKGRYQPDFSLSRSGKGNLLLRFTDRLYGTEQSAEILRALTVDHDGIRVGVETAVTAEQTADAAVYETLVRRPLRDYGFYLSADGSVVSLDNVPLLRCSRDSNDEAGISVFSCKELTGLLTETGLTDPYPAYSRYEDYLALLQSKKSAIEDYAASFYYRHPSKVAFADLTGDGQDELIYVYTDYTADTGYAYYEIVTSCGGYIVPLRHGVWQTGYHYPVQDRVDHAVALFRCGQDNLVYALDQTTRNGEYAFELLRLTPLTDYRFLAEEVPAAERNAIMDRADLLVLYEAENAPADGGKLTGRLQSADMSYAKAITWLETKIETLKKENGGDKETLELSETELRFTSAGATAVLKVEEADAGSVRWSSSNPAVASVGASGLVTALRPGTAVITASVGGRSAACTVVCDWEGDEPGPDDPGSEPLRLLKTDMTFFNPGEFFTLTVLNVPSGTAVSWRSTDPSVATVDANGKVVAVGAGTTTIVATVGDRTGECIVRCRIG